MVPKSKGDSNPSFGGSQQLMYPTPSSTRFNNNSRRKNNPGLDVSPIIQYFIDEIKKQTSRNTPSLSNLSQRPVAEHNEVQDGSNKSQKVSEFDGIA
jgi:hypothetical protein